MSLATSYAKALYEAAKEAGADSKRMDELENQIDSFGTLLRGSTDLRRALLAPVTNSKEKASVIDGVAKAAGYTPILRNFLILLASKERLPVFQEVREAFTTVRLEAEGGVAGRVVSADPLNETDVKGLSEAFSRKLGKRVALRVSTDASLLAGIKVTINGVTYDGSLRSQLQQLRDAVVAGHASR